MEDNLAVMSVGFLLGSPDDAVIWRGPKKNGKKREVTVLFQDTQTLKISEVLTVKF